MEEKSEKPTSFHISEFQPIPEAVLGKFPPNVMKKFLIVPLVLDKGRLLAAIPKVKNIVRPEGLDDVAGCPVDLITLPLAEITDFLDSHLAEGGKENPPPLSVIHPGEEPAPPALKEETHIWETSLPELKKEEKPPEDLPIGRPDSVFNLIKQALKERAREIVVNLRGEKPSIRFRIRGILIHPQNAKEFGKNEVREIFTVVRSKGETQSLREIQLSEWTVSLKEEGEEIVCQMILSEAEAFSLLTIRMAPKYEAHFDPKSWGLDGVQSSALDAMLCRKQGMILFCGPEKEEVNRLFYGCLQLLDSQEKRIISVEDQAHERLAGVDQFVAKKDPAYFEQLVEVAFQHRPDVLAVNPAKSPALFQKALEEALKGPLVLARSFSVDAADHLYQLLARNVEPYLLGSGLIGLVAHQTIRLNCQNCQEEDPRGRDFSKQLGIPPAMRPLHFYRGAGCPKCEMTGFDKEANLFEVIEMNDDLRGFLSAQAKPLEIRTFLKTQRFQTFRQTAIHKAINGQTSLSEVVRVTPK